MEKENDMEGFEKVLVLMKKMGKADTISPTSRVHFLAVTRTLEAAIEKEKKRREEGLKP